MATSDSTENTNAFVGEFSHLKGVVRATLMPEGQDRLSATISEGVRLHAELSGPETIISIENDYNDLINKPLIEGTVLIGDKTLEEIGLDEISVDDLLSMLL